MHRPSSALAAAALLVATGCATSRTADGPTLSPSAGSSSPASRGALIAYTAQSDLWLYDAATDSVRRLTTDGERAVERMPRFTAPDALTFVVNRDDGTAGAVYGIATSGGDPLEILRTPAPVAAYAWNAEGSALAFLAQASESKVGFYLRLANESVRLVREFAAGAGRGLRPGDDERFVQWSPEGRSILVVDTHQSPSFEGGGSDETLYVMTTDGRDVLPPRDGTFARWSADGSRIYYRGFDSASAWRELIVSTGAEAPLAMRQATQSPALSPDGSLIAHHDGSKKPALLVYDVTTRQDRIVATDHVAPVWMGTDAIAATGTRPCVEGDEGPDACGGHSAPWIPSGRVERLPAGGGPATPLSLTSTLDAGARVS